MPHLNLKTTFLAAATAISSLTVHAAVLRVNNTSGSSAPYSSLSAAVTAAAPGDTIYVEGSVSDYGQVTLGKRLNLIGSGYHLAETPANPRTQANTASSTISTLNFNKGSRGAIVQGFTLGTVYINDSAVTLQRNKLTTSVIIGSTNPVAFDTLRNNYFHSYISCNSSSAINGLMVYNNIFNYYWIIETTGPNINQVSGYFINNTFPTGTNTFKCVGFVFQNNIFGGNQDFNGYLSSNSFFNNVSVSTAGIPAGNGNVRGVSAGSLFLAGTTTPASTDGKYQLQSGSPAAGVGQMNGGPVDCGAFGGPAPYILSGMPSIPSIYSLSAPAQVSQGTTSINITISTAAH